MLTALLTRFLIPTDMANYFLAFSLVTATATIGMLGMDQTMVRVVASAIPAGNFVTAKKTIFLAFVWSGVGATALAILISLFGSSLGLIKNVFFLVGLWTVAQTFQNLLAEVYRSLHNIHFASLFQNRTIINAIVVLILLYVNISHNNINIKTLILFIVLVSIGTDAFGILILWAKLKKNYITKSDVLETIPLKHLNESLPILGINLLNIIKTQIGIWSIAAFLSKTDVALYGSAIRLAAIISIPLITIVNALLPPIIAELFAQNQLRKLEQIVRNLATYATIASAILTLTFLLGGEFALGFVFGDFYKKAQLILVILSLGQLFDSASGSCGVVLTMTGHQKSLLKITALSTFVTVFITFIAVLAWGPVGAAWASTIALVLSNILIIFIVKKELGIRTYIKFTNLLEVL